MLPQVTANNWCSYFKSECSILVVKNSTNILNELASLGDAHCTNCSLFDAGLIVFLTHLNTLFLSVQSGRPIPSPCANYGPQQRALGSASFSRRSQ